MRINRIKLNVAAVMAAAVSFGAARSFADTLTANVPFKFHVQEQQLPPGEYTVSQISNNGVPVLLLRNWEAGKSRLIVTRNAIDYSTDRRPRMVFQCGEGGCVLSEIWGATSGGGVAVSPPRNSDRSERASFVYLSRQKNGH
ncbi:MAG: hypothetical protein LAQ69_45410 [Acidobacteriia bacterium]|nr:hypothetical protein [Terriglobia bacterium]